jgi:NAD(P)-dependent dehydrogenase (short-subunit alcohol dehydrogenase family)
MVKALARYTNGNAHIVVVGRNEAAANSIIASLPKHENSQYEFVSCDATLVRNVKTVTTDLITRLPKLNFLVETSGYLTLKGREETDEGIDRKMALNFYSRWQFADDLLPLLKKAKEEGEDAKVMTILAAGRNGSINLDDLALKKNYSLAIAGAAVPSYNDLMVEVLNLIS